jgi:CheY-like chemotaxis protein
MPKVLVVDDSTTDRRVVGFLLARTGEWQVEYAFHGQEALEKMEHARYELVLTDLLMPALNGLELVAAIRRRRPQTPVILMTSRGNEGIALLALREGASSYIPKRLLPRKLAETVSRVMAVAGGRPGAWERAGGALEQLSATFALPNQVDAIRALVVHLQHALSFLAWCDDMDRIRIGVALQEALLNALYHGNLELDCAAVHGGALPSLLAERAGRLPYCQRKIHVQAVLGEQRAQFVVRDEGPGFDTSTLPDPSDVSALERATGRGVILMRLFMDDVVFDQTGREVTLIKTRSEGGREARPADKEIRTADAEMPKLDKETGGRGGGEEA